MSNFLRFLTRKAKPTPTPPESGNVPEAIGRRIVAARVADGNLYLTLEGGITLIQPGPTITKANADQISWATSEYR